MVYRPREGHHGNRFSPCSERKHFSLQMPCKSSTLISVHVEHFPAENPAGVPHNEKYNEEFRHEKASQEVACQVLPWPFTLAFGRPLMLPQALPAIWG